MRTRQKHIDDVSKDWQKRVGSGGCIAAEGGGKALQVGRTYGSSRPTGEYQRRLMASVLNDVWIMPAKEHYFTGPSHRLLLYTILSRSRGRDRNFARGRLPIIERMQDAAVNGKDYVQALASRSEHNEAHRMCFHQGTSYD